MLSFKEIQEGFGAILKREGVIERVGKSFTIIEGPYNIRFLIKELNNKEESFTIDLKLFSEENQILIRITNQDICNIPKAYIRNSSKDGFNKFTDFDFILKICNIVYDVAVIKYKQELIKHWIFPLGIDNERLLEI